MKKFCWMAAAAVSAILLLLGPVAAQAADTIKLACMEPLSGPAKDTGERYFEGVQYAVKLINEAGGLLRKKSSKLIAVDTEMKPDVAARKATNLILKEGVKFFCPGTGSSVGAAMSHVGEENNVLVYTYGMSAASLTGEKCNKNFFRLCGSTDMQSGVLAHMAVQRGSKRIAIIYQDYSFGKEAVNGFKKKLKQIGPSVQIVAEISHPLSTKDFAPYVSQLIAAKPDLIFTPNWGNDLYLLIKQGRSLGLNAKIVSYYVDDDEMIETVGNDSYVLGDFGAQIYMLTIPGKKNQEFMERAHKDLGHWPSRMANPFIATMFWAEAVKKAGATDTDAVIKAWEGLSYEGPAGVWTIRACDHQAIMPFWGAEIVKESKFFNHAYVGPATMIPAKEAEVPCAETGCVMKK